MSLLDRSRPVTIDGQQYDMLMTTEATIEIADMVGGLENFDTAIDALDAKDMLLMLTNLIVVLVNQGTAARKYKDPSYDRPQLTTETLRMTTTPSDLLALKGQIQDAIEAGMGLNIKHEDEEKNLNAG